MLDLMGRERLAEYDLFGTQGQWRRTYAKLLRLSVQGTPPDAPAVVRARAGLVAGKLTSYDNLDTKPSILDPRLPLALVGTRWQQSGAWQQALQRYWCPIEAGAFWYGDDREEKLQQVHLDYDFQIARFPVTNAEYARFIDTGGYEQQEWWTEQGWQYKQKQKWTAPRYWDDIRYNNPAQPVVGVTWYEAAAYCRWLTAQGHAQGWLPAEQEIRLPTSLEWERAARHTDQRPYPWGSKEPTPERANYDATEIGRPSPVGCFPAGAAECGAQDMAGNVLEWLATPYGKPEQEAPEKDFTPRDGVLVTWSAWMLGKEELLCGSRDWVYPFNGDGDLGFRVLQSLRSSV
jgi:formylglycine-generating enzyme required for sulfatase activity